MKTQRAPLPTHYRQGDVLVVRVAAVPAEATEARREHGRIILAHGEVTGHAHAIVSPDAAPFMTPEGELYIVVDEVSELLHEEHAPITLEPGAYKVVRQREYLPEEIRNVAD